MSTFMANRQSVEPTWWLIDGTNKVVGRLAVQIANILRGKHRPDFTPHADIGDFIIVINVEKVHFTGKKWDQKSYHHYTHYAGGLRETRAWDMLQRKPAFILQAAVRRMMPKNRLARKQMTKLKLYAGPSHPHQAQQPQELSL